MLIYLFIRVKTTEKILFELLKRGLEVWQVYDEWNTNEEVEDMNSVIKNKAEEYYNRYKEV